MIVPMKKVSLIVRGDRKEQTLRQLRRLGILHIETVQPTGERAAQLQQQMALLERALFTLGKKKKTAQQPADTAAALSLAERIVALDDEKKQCLAERIALMSEAERSKPWGDVDPASVRALADKGIEVSLHIMPQAAYHALPDGVQTVKLDATRSSVTFLLLRSTSQIDEALASALEGARVALPQRSAAQLRQQMDACGQRAAEIDGHIASYLGYADSLRCAVKALHKQLEFETCACSMQDAALSEGGDLSVCYFSGYIETDNLDRLQKAAAEHAWGLLSEDPTPQDNVPTKLKNNRFVSLIYPLTDFLGTVPGYFEYDISGWFLAFILIFFGIIFGDGGYGLLICAAVGVPMARALIRKKPVSPTLLLIALFGLSTVVWGTLTCTWFGLAPQQLPQWLQNLSVPVISNVYADTVWYPFWTNGTAGLTTAQNLQILCFVFALVQLSAAHIKCAITNRRSLKVIGDIGAAIELVGMFYLVLSFVVSGEVFALDLVVGGIPVGLMSLVMVAVGFLLSFVFANYEGSIVKSILASLANIVSVLLGIFNLFSDIVSYIRLWAVGLAGAAISATVNELAGPMLGNFMFLLLAIALLVFGHGLNIILNVLSVIVHGIRLNTLEFSSHLGMSWSGYKFKPFAENNE